MGVIEIKEVVTWLEILGIPTLFTLTVWCVKSCYTFANQLKILSRAQKAQMRSQLLEQYHKYEATGFVSEDDLEDWENQYKAYHALVGDNGVLDARRAKLLQMPTTMDGRGHTTTTTPIN